jgi:hypothetical protein
MGSTRLTAALVLGALAAVAAVGLGRLAPDPGAVFSLPEEHPVARATRLLNEVTAGDDVVVVVVHQTGDAVTGVLRSEGLEVLEAAHSAMESLPQFVAVRSVLNAPILTQTEGAMTAVTPLRPPPDSIDGWSEARGLLLGDRFVLASLLSADARTAALVGWLWSGTPDQWLARRASFALKEEAFRKSSSGPTVQALINEARMAVALGDEEGPADGVIARRLRNLAAEEPAIAELVADWGLGLGLRSAASASAQLQPLLEALVEPSGATGLRLAQVGEAEVEQQIEALYGPSLARGLALLALLAGLVNFALRRSIGSASLAAAAAPVALVVLLGLFGFLGVGLHPVSLACAFLAGWWALVFGTARGEGAGDDPLGMALWILPLGAGTISVIGYGAGGGPAAAATVLVAVLVAVACFTPRQQADQPPNLPSSSSLGLVSVGLLVGGAFLWTSGVGLDPSRMLAQSEDAGWAAATLAEDLGTVPAAFLVHDFRDGVERGLTEPEVLRSLFLAQQQVVDESAGASGSTLRSVIGWVDYVLALAAAMGDTEPLSGQRATIEQYLLMFHRPADTFALASSDLKVAVSILSLEQGAGPRLAQIAGGLSGPAPEPQLAGSALEMMVASRGAVQRGVTGLLALLVLFFGLGGTGDKTFRPRLAQAVVVVASMAFGLSGAVAVEGVVTASALLASLAAGGLIAASWSWGDRAALMALGLGGASSCGLLVSPILGLRGIGLVLLLACLAAWGFRAHLVWRRSL